MSTENVIHETGQLESSENITLFEQWWLPVDDPKAVLLVIHGIAEHSGRYAHVGKFFASKNIAVAAIDLRGHGQSQGKKAYVSSFNLYLDDLNTLLDEAKLRFPDIPVFLLGHSMGGAIVALNDIKNQSDVAGLILSGPAVKISDDISPLLQKVSGVIGAILPWLPTVKLDSAGICRDKNVVQAYDADPLCYRGGTLARTGAEVIQATKDIQSGWNKITRPILIMHGGDDKLADVSGSQMLHDGVSSSDKSLKIYDGLYHEILNEFEKEDIMNEIFDWISNRI